MQTVWHDGEIEQRTVSPVSLVITGFARVSDVRRTLTPQLKMDRGSSDLWLVDLGGGRDRLGGSALTQVFNRAGGVPPDLEDPKRLRGLFDMVQEANRAGLLLAYHDRSDGGVITTLLEMAFAGHCGLEIHLDGWAEATLRALFNEELGAVMQVAEANREAFEALLVKYELAGFSHRIGRPKEKLGIKLYLGNEVTFKWQWSTLFDAWNETSHAMQRLRDNPLSADAEKEWRQDDADPGITPKLTFDIAKDPAAALSPAARGRGWRSCASRASTARSRWRRHSPAPVSTRWTCTCPISPAVGSSWPISAAWPRAAASPTATCSVPAAAGPPRSCTTTSCASSSRRSSPTRRKFALGVCNGCQMLSQLKDIIPGAQHWPKFLRNASEQYEARLATVEILDSPSLFFKGMTGSRIPVAVAHGEGRVSFPQVCSPSKAHAAVRFVDNRGKPTENYPLNPNGSPGGLAGFTAADGRVTILMPHPERVFRTAQLSWHPENWGEDSPWMRMFRNARAWCG